MCFPFGGGQQGLVLPPNDKARKYGDLFRVLLIGYIVLVVAYFLVFEWISGLIDILGGVIGYLSVRDRNGYNAQQMLCFTILAILRFVWGLVELIAFAAGVSEKTFSTSWGKDLYAIVFSVGCLYYFFMGYLAFIIYGELRKIAAAFVYGGGFDQGAPPPNNFPAPGWARDEDREDGRPQAPAAAPQGFQAFSGKGYRLGGN